MTTVVNPSNTPATIEQFGKVSDLLTAGLRKSGMRKDPLQQVIERSTKQLTDDLVAVVRKHVEAMSEIIVRRVKVDRNRTPQQVVDATGRTQYVNKDVLNTMPKGEGDEVDVWFVPTKRHVPAPEVPAFLARYGLGPDPRAQTTVNEEDPAFADKVPNGTQWGDNCCLAFLEWHGDRWVDCRRRGSGWRVDWFLAGVPLPGK